MTADTLVLKTILNGLYFSGAQLASRFWFSGLGGILMLHHVREENPGAFSPNAGLTVSPTFLDRLLGSLIEKGTRFISMDELCDRLVCANKPDWDEPVLAVTLDDGYRDNLLEAAPVFGKHKVPYTVYVAPGLVDGRANLWWEDLEAIIAKKSGFHLHSPGGNVSFDASTPSKKRNVFNELMEFLTQQIDEKEQRRIVNELARQEGVDPARHRQSEIMSWAELSTLAADPLCTIGAHTIHHYAVARLKRQEALSEMVESASVIEMELGKRPIHFAYPYGSEREAGPRDFDLAKEAGFRSAVTTRHGVIYPEHANHLHGLPRISVNGRFQACRYVETLLSGLPTRIRNRGARLNVA